MQNKNYTYLDGYFVFGEGAALQQLVDTVYGEVAGHGGVKVLCD